jgi:hypothetical protein
MASLSSTDFNTKLPIYIPRIDTRSLPRCPLGENREKFVKGYIAHCFHTEQIGKVQRVDLLEKTTPDGWNFYVAFCHFEEWYDNEKARALQADILQDSVKARFFFDTEHHGERSYWILNENKKPLSEEEARLGRIIYEHERAFMALRDDFEKFKQEVADRDRATTHLIHQLLSATGGKFQIYQAPYSSGRR